MINQAIFQNAHALAEEINQPGDNYQATFSACLKALYAKLGEMKAESARTGKHIRVVIAYAMRDMMVKARKAIRENQQSNAAQQNANWTTRRVMPVAVAERDGLNRGKSWFCGERDIQTKGACPSWEGQAICYVYA